MKKRKTTVNPPRETRRPAMRPMGNLAMRVTRVTRVMGNLAMRVTRVTATKI